MIKILSKYYLVAKALECVYPRLPVHTFPLTCWHFWNPAEAAKLALTIDQADGALNLSPSTSFPRSHPACKLSPSVTYHIPDGTRCYVLWTSLFSILSLTQWISQGTLHGLTTSSPLLSALWGRAESARPQGPSQCQFLEMPDSRLWGHLDALRMLEWHGAAAAVRESGFLPHGPLPHILAKQWSYAEGVLIDC